MGVLEYFILYLVAYPDVQAKVLDELDRVVGERRVSLKDRDELHYLSAFIQETTRIMPFALLPPSRRALDNVTLSNGMVIPKGAQVPLRWHSETPGETHQAFFAGIFQLPRNSHGPEKFSRSRNFQTRALH